MNAAPLARRPLGCLKASLRQARQQRTTAAAPAAFLARQLSTVTPTVAGTGALPEHNFFRMIDKKTKKTRSAFAVYAQPPPVPATTAAQATLLPAPPPDPMPHLAAEQIKSMDPTGARTALFTKTRYAARVGDVLMVTHRRGGEPFAGVCLAIRRNGIDTSVLLRNHLSKVGVEMWYKVYNRNVAGIEIVKRRAKRARRAKLTYMRQPKHDMGSVADLVFAWKKTRKVIGSKPGAGKGAQSAKKRK
ncbi:translation protein SH3-like domain-containing protein [Podospora appendiculata]|uniref:Translation protein SH3-like domain-containing protein n=1 Tax=Podospora appendiculata TaxID=314037 RepID=A0AAE0X1H9_9PEZI|nr:translation protein SH3-like domain-containing protein [Podospora appendiculata]